jgi:hypothetical protein
MSSTISARERIVDEVVVPGVVVEGDEALVFELPPPHLDEGRLARAVRRGEAEDEGIFGGTEGGGKILGGRLTAENIVRERVVVPDLDVRDFAGHGTSVRGMGGAR